MTKDKARRQQNIQRMKKAELRDKVYDLIEVAEAQREYLKAIPDEFIDQFPAMPGFDGDWADDIIDNAQ